jgi:hypothetical protein
MSKYKILSTQQQMHTYNELKYMAQLNNPFIVSMQGIAQDARNIYLLMDFV